MSRVAIITGCSSGIGLETAKGLACDPEYAKVILGVRNIKKMMIGMESWSSGMIGKCEVLELNLASFDSVKKFSDNFKSERIDRLVLNAGINDYTNPSKRTTIDGVDEIWQANFFSNFLLVELLRKYLVEGSRVVCLSSVMHWVGRPDAIVSSLSPTGTVESGQNWWSTYADTKFAITAYAHELNKRNIHAIAVNPGSVSSDIFRNYYSLFLIGNIIRIFFRLILLSCEEGSRTSLFACRGKELSRKFYYLSPYGQIRSLGKFVAFLCDIHWFWICKDEVQFVGVCAQKVPESGAVLWNKSLDLFSRCGIKFE
jgi:NAD(P)-dependent dehydrogenase (short-subunit alcohol dehydrogenase family)